jgi:hypothetical protein
MKSFKTFSLCLALCLVGFVSTAGAQTIQPSNTTGDSKASCCSASCCAGMGQHHSQHHAAAQAARGGQSAKDCDDCCTHCADCCKSGGDCCRSCGESNAAQSCSTCKIGAQHKHAGSHHADGNGRKADCCAGCTCCAAKEAAR